jgi:polyhydroxyalkanoate synthesis regulator phasin
MDARKSFFAAIGLAAEIGGKARALFEELIERGRLRRNDTLAPLDRLVGKVKGERGAAGKILRDILRDALDMAGLATNADVAELEERLAPIESQFEALKRNCRKSQPGDKPLKKTQTGKPHGKQH